MFETSKVDEHPTLKICITLLQAVKVEVTDRFFTYFNTEISWNPS